MKKPHKIELSSDLRLDQYGKLREYKSQKEVIGLKEIHIDLEHHFININYITK